jgi:hypothetical protein
MKTLPSGFRSCDDPQANPRRLRFTPQPLKNDPGAF